MLFFLNSLGPYVAFPRGRVMCHLAATARDARLQRNAPRLIVPGHAVQKLLFLKLVVLSCGSSDRNVKPGDFDALRPVRWACLSPR